MNTVVTQIHGITSVDFLNEIKEIKDIFISLSKKQQSDPNDELITRQEASKILKVSISTLDNWKRAGIITSYRIGNKVRYKKSEILDSLTKINQDNY